MCPWSPINELDNQSEPASTTMPAKSLLNVLMAIRRSLPLLSTTGVLIILAAVVLEIETSYFSEYQRRRSICNRAMAEIRAASPRPLRFVDCTISASLVGLSEPKGTALIRRVVTINVYDQASGQFIGTHSVTLDGHPFKDVR